MSAENWNRSTGDSSARPLRSGLQAPARAGGGLSWYDLRWRVLPYVIYICRNGNIVLGNRRYLPLWVWEREPASQVGTPEWEPVNERTFVQGIVMSLHTYDDGDARLPRRKMIAHVNAKLEAFRLGGLPPDWERHRQATDRKDWSALRSPPEEGDNREGITAGCQANLWSSPKMSS